MNYKIIVEKKADPRRIWRVSSRKCWCLLAPNYIEVDGKKIQYKDMKALVKAAGNTMHAFTFSKARRFMAMGFTFMHVQTAQRISRGAITPEDIYADELFNEMLKNKRKTFRKEEKELVYRAYIAMGLEESLKHIEKIKTR